MTQRAARGLAIFRVDAASVETIQIPEEVPPEWAAEAREAIRSRGDFSVFDDITINAMLAELRQLPWVKSARELDRRLPRSVRIALAPRAPVAGVEAGAALILVDEEGVVLPPAVFPASRVAGLPRIVKWRGEFTVPQAGKVWNDEGALDGVSVAKLLPQFYITHIAPVSPGLNLMRIDVSNAGGAIDPKETEIFFTCGNGVRIKWGRAPRSAKFGEITPEMKFNNLAAVLRDFPNLDALSAVNIRFDVPDVFDRAGRWIPRTAVAGRAGH